MTIKVFRFGQEIDVATIEDAVRLWSLASGDLPADGGARGTDNI